MSRQATTNANTFFIRTFGCQMNRHDSEHIAGVLASAGYSRADSIDDADIAIFNTCCVRQSAEDRVWGNLASLASPDRGPKVVAVTGCMAERHREGVIERAGAVDLVFGMDALERLPSLIEACLQKPLCDLGEVQNARIDRLPESREGGARAWVPVSHGCDNDCAYCVVPAVRGRQRSREPEEIASEVARLSGEGVLEVVLLGQNVNSYGRDLSSPAGFARLLEKVASVDGIRRVKFETSHPRDLTRDILEVMASVPQVCEYLHLPVQSGSDRVLEGMNRGYGRDYYIEKAMEARALVTGLTLTTDVIVGFPGETEEDFAATLDLVGRVAFDAAYVFLYSARAGTMAAELADEVPDAVKHRRYQELAALQDATTERSLGGLVSTVQEVLLEGPAKRGGMVRARTRGNRVVLLPGPSPAGPVLDVLITGAGRHALRGVVADGKESTS